MDSKDKWYRYLKGKIMSESRTCGELGHAFVHGQVLFARTAGLITEEQKDKLSDMIPDYG